MLMLILPRRMPMPGYMDKLMKLTWMESIIQLTILSKQLSNDSPWTAQQQSLPVASPPPRVAEPAQPSLSHLAPTPTPASNPH